VDWNNHIDRSAGRWTPFADLGLANGISDTHFFTRPYTTLGNVFHVEAGTDYELYRHISVGASYYGDAPFGNQKVYSRVVKRGGPKAANPPGKGKGLAHRVFENDYLTSGSAEVAQDYGYNAWIGFYPSRAFSLEVGYSHSTMYAYDTISFGIGFRISRIR
jgi:hypothetical protein